MEHEDNLLRYNVNFTTDELASSYVEFGFIDDIDTIWNRTNLHEPATTHQLTIIGIPELSECIYRVVAFNSTGFAYSSFGSFTTDFEDSFYLFTPVSIFEHEDYDAKGYIIMDGLNRGQYQIYDRQGRAIWYQLNTGPTIENSCKRFNIFEGNSILIADCKEIVEMNWQGEVLHEIDLSGLANEVLHHDLMKLEDEFITLTAKAFNIDTVPPFSTEGDVYVGDGIVVVNEANSLLWHWSVFNHLDPQVDTGHISFPSFWVSIFGIGAKDWTHGNSVFRDEDGNYLLSLKNFSTVFKVNATSGQIMWSLGQRGDIPMPDGYHFSDQHNFHRNRDGHLMLFDNLGGPEGASRILEFDLNIAADTTVDIIWEYVLNEEDWSDIGSNVNRLENGNTLIASTRGQSGTEVSPEGEVLWRMKQSTTLFRGYYLDDLYERPGSSPTSEMTGAQLCLNESPIMLEATPIGGYFDGSGVENGIFNPGDAGIGNHTIQYYYGWDTLEIPLEVIVCSSIEENSIIPAVTISPNPANSTVRLEYNSPSINQVSIRIYDIYGKMVVQKQRMAETGTSIRLSLINITEWKSGMYYVQFEQNNRLTASPFIVLH